MFSLLAQAIAPTIWNLAIAILVIGGVIAIVMVILNRIGITIPDWFMKVVYIVFAVVVGLFAIKLIMSFV